MLSIGGIEIHFDRNVAIGIHNLVSLPRKTPYQELEIRCGEAINGAAAY